MSKTLPVVILHQAFVVLITLTSMSAIYDENNGNFSEFDMDPSNDEHLMLSEATDFASDFDLDENETSQFIETFFRDGYIHITKERMNESLRTKEEAEEGDEVEEDDDETKELNGKFFVNGVPDEINFIRNTSRVLYAYIGLMPPSILFRSKKNQNGTKALNESESVPQAKQTQSKPIKNDDSARIGPSYIRGIRRAIHDRDLSSLTQTVYKKNNNSVAIEQNKQGVLCIVKTLLQLQNGKSRFKYVKSTWGKRCCDRMIFTKTANKNLTIKDINGTIFLRGKTADIFTHVYNNYGNQSEWYLHTHDDTYVIKENLRNILARYKSNDPIYFGLRLKNNKEEKYMHGGAGYVISNKALHLLVTQGLSLETPKCNFTGKRPEELKIANCMNLVGVKPVDSRDSLKRETFLPFMPKISATTNKFWKRAFYPNAKGYDCCSRNPVSFHRVEPKNMKYLEYIIYYQILKTTNNTLLH